MSTPTTAATTLTRDELQWLLALRPGASSDLVAAALGIELDGQVQAPPSAVERGATQHRHGLLLPRGDLAVIGDVFTRAEALVNITTAQGPVALIAVCYDRVLLLAPSAPDCCDVAALDADADPAAAAATIASAVTDAQVMVAIPDGDFHTMSAVTEAELATEIGQVLP